MKEKIKELHALVVDGGLHGTQTELENTFKVLTTSRPGSSKPKGNKCNSNAVIKSNKGGKSRDNCVSFSPSQSEETIYKYAVQTKNHNGSSSEDFDVNTSDEIINAEFGSLNVISGPFVDDMAGPSGQGETAKRARSRSRLAPIWGGEVETRQPEFMGPEDRSAQILREAEAAKARILPTPGKFLHTVMVDETYIVVANHVDDNTVARIQKGEYVEN